MVRDLVHARTDVHLSGRLQHQLTDWLTKANTRVVRAIKAAPVGLIDADRAAMLPLPPIPLHLGWRNKIRLGRDYYVRLDTNDYSVDPALIGRMVDVACRPRPRPRPRPLRGPLGGLTPPGLGQGNDPHRPDACRDSRLVAQAVPTTLRGRCSR